MRLPLPDYLEVVLTQMLARFPFFGILASQMPLVQDPEAAGGTASTDGSAIYYDPAFMEQMRELGDEYPAFVLAHEVLHPALGHLWRLDDREPRRWNRACDIVINRILQEAGLPVPPNALTARSAGLLDQAAHLSEEEVYNLLKDDVPMAPTTMDGDMILPADSGQDGQEQASPQTPDLQSVWRDRLLSAAQAARTQGTLPAGIQLIVDAILSPTVEWRRTLAEFVSPSQSDYDWRRPDRRLLAAADIYLPTLHSECLRDIVVAIDTSGSTCDHGVRLFLTELVEILQAYPEVTAWVLSCDTEVHAALRVDQNVSVEDLVRTLYGKGSTDFRPVFRWVEDQGLNPSCLVYFTDGMGTYPDKPPPYPVLWVLTPDHQAPPWGKITVLSDGGADPVR